MHQKTSQSVFPLARAVFVALTTLFTTVAFATLSATDFTDWTFGPLSQFFSQVSANSINFCWIFASVMGLAMFPPESPPLVVDSTDRRTIESERSASFWSRYLVGAVTIPLFVTLPLALAARPWMVPAWQMFTAHMVCIPAMHLAIFSVSSLVACVVRRPVYAVIISGTASLLVVGSPMDLSVVASPIEARRNLALFLDGDLTIDVGTTIKYLGWMLTVSCTAIVFAARAVHRDIAWRKPMQVTATAPEMEQ